MKARTSTWSCIGCACTDRCACPGGCSWVRPHLCSACDGKDVFKPSKIVVDIIVAAIRGRRLPRRTARIRGYRRIAASCSVPSLAMLAFMGDDFLVDTDRKKVAAGHVLKPTTRVSMGFDGVWRFKLIWSQPIASDEVSGELREEHCIRLNMGHRLDRVRA